MSSAPGSWSSTKKASIDPARSSICRTTHSNATMSGPRSARYSDSYMRRLLLKALAALTALLVVVAVGAYVLLRRSLPSVNGEAAVAGLAAPLDVVRDADAIPHIFASTKRDALFG